MKVMIRLLKMINPLKYVMLLGIFLGTLGHLAAAFITILGGFGIVSFVNGDIDGLTFIFIIMGVSALARGFLRYGEQTCNHYIAFKILAIIRDKVFVALRRLCPAKLDGHGKGNLISIITADIELLEVFFAHTISPVAIATIFSIIIIAFIGSYGWILGLWAAVAYVCVGFIIPVIMSKLSAGIGDEMREKSGDMSSNMLDNLRGLKEIIQFSYGDERIEQMAEKSLQLSETEKKLKANLGANIALTSGVIMFFDFGMLFIASYLSKGTGNLEGVVIPVFAMFSSFGPVIALANLGSSLNNTLASARRVFGILDEKPVVEDIAGNESVEFTGARVENLNFSYTENDQENMILEGINVEIKKNEILGIIGKSGSGKSTLLKLLMRFWKVDSGHIYISDRDIDKINTSNLRELESFVTQETELFRDTIENNIKIAKLDATREEVIEACKKASVHDFIMTLPNGYDSEVGELGETLSGGERQRLGVARAFLHDSPLILMDEPTSNLDSLNEGAILKVLKNEANGKSVVLVSHRESTMKIADRIYKIDNGRVS